MADAVRGAQASFKTLIELSSELVLLHRDARVVYVNPALARAIGVENADELTHTAIVELFHVDDGAVVSSRLLAPSADATPEAFGLRWLRKDGGHRTTEAVVAPIEFEGLPTVVVVARDVTERVEFQHQLLQRDRMAALGTLAAGVAHEINNPLTYLLVNLEHVLRWLRAASASDDPIGQITSAGTQDGLAGLVQSLTHAVEGANRVRQIVRDLLTFTQGNVDQRTPVDVRGIVESAVQMAWHEIRVIARGW